MKKRVSYFRAQKRGAEIFGGSNTGVFDKKVVHAVIFFFSDIIFAHRQWWNAEKSFSARYYLKKNIPTFLFLFIYITSTEGKVVYIIQGNHLNDIIFNINSIILDDFTFTIGTFIALINPIPITSTCRNEIPIV